jgi:hypothetical protein
MAVVQAEALLVLLQLRQQLLQILVAVAVAVVLTDLLPTTAVPVVLAF